MKSPFARFIEGVFRKPLPEAVKTEAHGVSFRAVPGSGHITVVQTVNQEIIRVSVMTARQLEAVVEAATKALKALEASKVQ